MGMKVYEAFEVKITMVSEVVLDLAQHEKIYEMLIISSHADSY